MRIALILTVLAVSPGLAYAGIPQLNAKCPTGIEVHADEGGPVYINGKEGNLKKVNDNYYEITHGGLTISLSINPDGSPSLSYTRTHQGNANGICTISDGGDTVAPPKGCPPDVSEADRSKYPDCK